MTAVTQHPSYPSPTIVEALCEVHFVLSPEKPWRASLPGEFFKVIQDEYPEMEPLQNVGLQFEMGPEGLGQRVLPPRQQVRFRHATRQLLLQLAEDTLTINVLAPYPGWDTMVRDVLQAWQKAAGVLSPSAVTQVGLRYINRIETTSTEDRPGDWIKASDYIAPVVLNSAPGFLSRVEVRLNVQDSIIVTLGDQPSGPSGGHGAIIFDIDRVSQQNLAPQKDGLEQEINRLHEDVWQVFNSAKSDRLELLLKGKS